MRAWPTHHPRCTHHPPLANHPRVPHTIHTHNTLPAPDSHRELLDYDCPEDGEWHNKLAIAQAAVSMSIDAKAAFILVLCKDLKAHAAVSDT